MTELADHIETLAKEMAEQSNETRDYFEGFADGLRAAAEIVRKANVVYWDDPDDQKPQEKD